MTEVQRTVDMHCHVGTPACVDLSRAFLQDHVGDVHPHLNRETLEYNEEQFRLLAEKLVDPTERLRDMDSMGIDVQAISVAPPQYYYWADPELGLRLSMMQNDHLAELVEGNPDRFVALGTVPLQDTAAAVGELERCVNELGFRGVEICTSVNSIDLDDPRFRRFFARASELGVVVLLHPEGFAEANARLAPYYLSNVIGNPLDTTVAASKIIHGGVLEEYPDLRLCLSHGGGFLPFYSSRMDHSYEFRPEGRKRISKPPSHYLKMMYFDCLVFDAAHLGFLVSQVGVDHVVVGTDYPFDMGHYDPLGQIDSVATLTDEERAMIKGGNAMRLLGLAS